MTRGSLYPLALNGCKLDSWLQATTLSNGEVQAALRLAGFLDANVRAGRDKLTLFLPKKWAAGAVWTKQDFEESLGKSDELGIKIAIQEKLKLANYRSTKEETQDRCFLVVNVAGEQNPDSVKVGVSAPSRLSARGPEAERRGGRRSLHAVHPLRGVRSGLFVEDELRYAAER